MTQTLEDVYIKKSFNEICDGYIIKKKIPTAIFQIDLIREIRCLLYNRKFHKSLCNIFILETQIVIQANPIKCN